jgi:rifampicin phosphotransferase
MGPYVLGFERSKTQVAILGRRPICESSPMRAVPAGFCVTTDAFQRILAEAPSIDDRLDLLSRAKPIDREAIRALSSFREGVHARVGSA